jgi:hypothetical protein
MPALLLMSVLALADAPAPTLAFGLPIACDLGRTCEIQNYVDRDPGPGSKDYRCGSRSYDVHNGIDFRLLDMRLQKAGVAVLAAADGKVSRVRDGVADVSVREAGAAAVKGQECGNGLVVEHAGGLSTQYCHMAKGSLVVKPGALVKAGDKLGLVGLSGNTEYPHLHFTVRRGQTLIDPFAPDTTVPAGQCGAGASLWRADVKASLAYKAGAVLNAGFAGGAVDMAAIEAGVAPPTASAGVLVAYVRAIGLQAGDQQSLVVRAPDGEIVAQTDTPPLPRDQAQRLLYVGKPRPSTGWRAGRYEAVYRVVRNGRAVIERRWSIGL